MEKFVITGGKPLHGEVTISGAKNAAVGILPATILAADVCVIENLPDISDVAVSLKILSTLGASIKMLNRNTYEIDTTHLNSTNVPDDLSRQMRASYYFLGALLSRFGKAQVAMPGGCNLGPRPIDQHLKVFSALGAEDSVDYGMITVRAKELNGAHIFFDKVSVGATMNGMLSAVMAQGQTILENCAKEPHVVDLANFLNMCGADVRGAGTDVIKVRGVEKMHGCTYSIIPDQIEAGSYMVAAAATGGDVLIKNVTPKHLEPITAKLRRAGVDVEEFDDSVRVSRKGDILPLKINTMPHPGFPTDMQPLMGVLLSVAKGTSTITESVWDNRFRYVDELRKMGAVVQVDGQVAVFEGVDKLNPAPLRASDLRAGAAMVVAALMADGTSEIEEIGHIERGYENIVEKLRGLGADISKVDRVPAALEQARKGRMHILGKLTECIAEPREDYKPCVPRIVQIVIPQDMIGPVIGPGGKVIQDIQKTTGTTITITEVDNKGIVDIFGQDKTALDGALNRIKAIVAIPEIGETYHGKIRSIVTFGAFVEIMPGKDALLHISEIDYKRFETMEETGLKEGDMIEVKVIGIDPKTNKLKLSHRVLIPQPEGWTEPERRPRERGDRPRRRPEHKE